MGDLQQTGPDAGWLWYVILAVLLLIVVWWLFSRRKTESVHTRTEKSVSRNERSSADDLTKLEGIGPKVAKVLNDAEITTFDDLARAKAGDVKSVLNEAGLQMMNPEGWIEQARLAAKGDWEAVERLQGELKGGRKK
jgi:LPXTG-motif cell wall-anchored protein